MLKPDCKHNLEDIIPVGDRIVLALAWPAQSIKEFYARELHGRGQQYVTGSDSC
jgi:hypothetical protein